MVENHGGPISNYGDRFSPEVQLYASDGFVVFYPNPRGSTSYGEEFGNLLYHNYPGEDYLDVMDGVDTVIEKGYVTEDSLFVTGGSAGGIMTAWIIGKNNRFRSAAVVKPVMNWISKTLTADNHFGYANTRFSRSTLGEHGSLHEILSHIIGRERNNADTGNGRAFRFTHTTIGSKATVPCFESEANRDSPGHHTRVVSFHFKPTKSINNQN